MRSTSRRVAAAFFAAVERLEASAALFRARVAAAFLAGVVRSVAAVLRRVCARFAGAGVGVGVVVLGVSAMSVVSSVSNLVLTVDHDTPSNTRL